MPHSFPTRRSSYLAKAWASQDVDAYLAMYATYFTPEGGISRETWVAQRRDRISTPKKISVRVIDPKTSDIEDGAVRVSRSEEHKSELQSLLRISYVVFCLITQQLPIGNIQN